MKHYNITVSGKVQGVYFRAYAERKADELKLMGFVRNLNNGDVYIEAEGKDDQLKPFIDWCHKGSPRAVVNSVKVEEAPVQGFDRFEVRR